MEQEKSALGSNTNRLDWLIFAVTLIAMLALLMWENRFFWVMLPFVATYLVKSLRML